MNGDSLSWKQMNNSGLERKENSLLVLQHKVV
jgi:hypothetical protein